MAAFHCGVSCPDDSRRPGLGRRLPGRVVLAVAAVPFALALLGPAQRVAAQPRESLKVTVADGAVSVEAVDAPLERVLVELGKALHARILIETVLAPSLKAPVTRSFSEVPALLALRRLLVGQNYTVMHGPTGIDEVRVFVDGKTGYRDMIAADKGQPSFVRFADSPPDDPAEISRLRQAALRDPDASARRRALDELASIEDSAVLRDTLAQVLARERDGRVLEALFAVAAQQKDGVSPDALRSFVASDRDGTARAQALDLLAAQAGDEPATLALLRKLAATDASADVREVARTALHDLETPGSAAPLPSKRR